MGARLNAPFGGPPYVWRMSNVTARVFALALAASAITASSMASAQDPAPPKTPTKTDDAVVQTAVTPKVAPDADCALEHYLGVSYEDAIAIEEVVCSEARAKNKTTAKLRVRVSKLGGQIIVRLTSPNSSMDRQIIVSNVEEVVVAAPRLIDASLEARTVAETENVDNIVGGEVRNAKAKKSRVNANLGVIGTGTTSADPSAGLMMAITAGDARWSFVTDVRLTGDALEDTVGIAGQVASLGIWKPKKDAPSSFGSLAGGVRHHLNGGSTAIYVGMGIGLDHVSIRRNDQQRTELKNTGLGSYAEIGLDVLRTNTVGGTVAFRFDAPFFAVQGERAATVMTDPPRTGPQATQHLSAWTPMGTVAFAMRF